MRGALSVSRWRCELSACSISSVNLTYALRADRRTGFRSYMPLEHSPPFTVSAGRSKSRRQSVVRITPARWAPEEWPETYAVGIAAEAVSVALHPRDGAAYLRGHRHEAAADVLDRGEVRHDEMRARPHEQLGRECVVAGEAGPPRAPVDEDVDRGVGARGGIDVEGLDRCRAVCVAPRRAKSYADGVAVARVALDDLISVGRPDALVVGRVELGLIQVEPHARPRALDPSRGVSQVEDGAGP